MKASKIVKKHLDMLEHFLEQGGHPIKVLTSQAVELSELGFPIKQTTKLPNSESIIAIDETKHWDWELVAEFWKYRFQEEFNEVKRIYDIVDTAYRKL